MTTRRARPAPRGFTILEAVIAMAILLVGVVGTLHTLVYGANSDRGARAQTLATKAANELVAALAQLPTTDLRLTPNASSSAVPDPFGPLLSSDGTLNTSGSHVWSDGSAIPGVRTDAQLAQGPERMLEIERRWVVWDYVPPGSPGGQLVRLFSVSVVYRDPALREIVMYGQRADLGGMLVRTILQN